MVERVCWQEEENTAIALCPEGYLDIYEDDDGNILNLADSRLFPGIVIAGFFTGGALAVRGGLRAARNSAIGGAVLLAIFEGVGIAVQRMMAENTRLDVSSPFFV